MSPLARTEGASRDGSPSGCGTYDFELLSDAESVMRHIDLRPELPRVTCPSLVIAGDLDPWGSVEAAAEIVEALPGPRVRYDR